MKLFEQLWSVEYVWVIPVYERAYIPDIQLDVLREQGILSVRTRNCLASKKINTLAELAQCSAWELQDIRNFGESCLIQVQKVLTKYNLVLGNTPPEN